MIRIWKVTLQDGTEVFVEAMSKEYAVYRARAIRAEEVVSVTPDNKDLEFCKLIEMREKGASITLNYLLNIGRENELTLTANSLDMICSHIPTLNSPQVSRIVSAVYARVGLGIDTFSSSGYTTVKTSVPRYAIECLRDGRLSSYKNCHIVYKTGTLPLVTVFPDWLQREASFITTKRPDEILNFASRTGHPVVINRNGQLMLPPSRYEVTPTEYLFIPATDTFTIETPEL